MDFEKSILDVEAKIRELQHLSDDDAVDISSEVKRLQGKVQRLLKQTYSKLTPDQRLMVARHPERPHCLDYIAALFEEFVPIAGDRLYSEDHALPSGIARFRGRSCVVMGHEKGHDTQSRIQRNFGMVRPEGYRKAQRLVQLAERFSMPVISFVDTAGAYPGVGAEERGQSEAIARSIQVFLQARTPTVAIIIGEGGSGGAVGIAASDRVFMLEHAVYSVISPEGCASILWRSGEYTKQAAQALRLTSEDLLKLGVIDEIIKEPLGGAHRNRKTMFKRVGASLETALEELSQKSVSSVIKARQKRYLSYDGRKSLAS